MGMVTLERSFRRGWSTVDLGDPFSQGMRPERSNHDPIASGDRDLVEGSLRGERHSLTSLVGRLKCVPRILASLNNRMGFQLSEHDLADLSQDTLVVIWRKLESFEGRARLETWVYRICYLEFMNRVRRHNRISRLASVRIDKVVDSVAAPATPSALDYEQLERGLVELGSPEADVIRLKHFEECTFKDIGQLLKIPANTAKTYYYRGIDWLRRRLSSSQEGTRP